MRWKSRRSMEKISRQAAWVATVISLPITALVIGSALINAKASDPVTKPSARADVVGPYPTGPTSIAMPRLVGQAPRICPAFVSKLPPTIHGIPQRPVAAGPERAAAYGEPAITVVCGASMPTIGRTDLVFRLGDVCWHSVDRSDVTVFTTADRAVVVQLTVPRRYQQPMVHTSHQPDTSHQPNIGELTEAVDALTEYGKWAILFSDPVITAVPSVPQRPTGCTD
ncbi:DUF3515 family protein [Micromonospora rubida]